MGSIHSMYLGDEPLRILGERESFNEKEEVVVVVVEADLTVLMLPSTQNHEMRVSVSWHCDQYYDNGYNTDVEEDELHNKEKRKKVHGVKK